MPIALALILPVVIVLLVILLGGAEKVDAWAPSLSRKHPQPQPQQRPGSIKWMGTTYLSAMTNKDAQPTSSSSRQRRALLQKILNTATTTAGTTILVTAFGFQEAVAAATEQQVEQQAATDGVYTRRQPGQFQYEFRPPPGFTPGQKPLKTHLDEVNFQSSDRKGYQFGITVDPVRINSLKDFGTPEEVAAKVVLAEVNRDGVLDVKLMEDPYSSGGDDGLLYYQLNYLSSGKRGDKRFVAKFYIRDQKLYALTAQCREADYNDAALRQEMRAAVDSFRVLRP